MIPMWIGWFLRVLLIVVGLRAIWKFFAGVVEGAQERRRTVHKSVALVRDPVCGTYVVRSRAVVLRQGDQIEYFCSKTCQRRFSF